MMHEESWVPSPCRSICRLGPDDVCDGCGRTIAEIVGWVRLEPDARQKVMSRVAAWVSREPKPGERQR
jgi:predicted Fe-S protein YdhL (DUF1289 family)